MTWLAVRCWMTPLPSGRLTTLNVTRNVPHRTLSPQICARILEPTFADRCHHGLAPVRASQDRGVGRLDGVAADRWVCLLEGGAAGDGCRRCRQSRRRRLARLPSGPGSLVRCAGSEPESFLPG
jgi:hypothetical protein